MDTRLADPEIIGLLFSALGLVESFEDSSAEVVEGFGLWAEPADAAAVAGIIDRRPVEVAGGRVGGLLSALPVVTRAVDVVGLTTELTPKASVRLPVVAKGRLGGMPFFLGELPGHLESSGARFVLEAELSSPERMPSSLSSAGMFLPGPSTSIMSTSATRRGNCRRCDRYAGVIVPNKEERPDSKECQW